MENEIIISMWFETSQKEEYEILQEVTLWGSVRGEQGNDCREEDGLDDFVHSYRYCYDKDIKMEGVWFVSLSFVEGKWLNSVAP